MEIQRESVCVLEAEHCREREREREMASAIR
jgi:hypothetical protein